MAAECEAETRLNPLGRSSLGSRIWVVAAAAVPAALYFLYVFHYSVNVPFADDWSDVPIVSAALHGHLTMSLLWSPWSDAREVTGRLVFIAFGFIDHMNERAVMFFSAALFLATYVLVLLLFRSYLGRRLTPLPVFVLGIAWFSLVDWQSALWSTVVNGYLVLFFVVLAMYFLLVPHHHTWVYFGLGVVAAVLASLSFSFGFLAWPLGLICLLWIKRGRAEVVLWILAAALTAVVYFHGFHGFNTGCSATPGRCSLTYGLSRPVRLIEYYVLLVGNVIPLSATGIESHLWVHEMQGTVLLVAALLVVIQTFRERRVQPNPLPLLLIVFGLLYDLMIAPARFGVGLIGAVSTENSRYTMPSVLLVVAIVIYVWAHARTLHSSSGLRLVGLGTLAALLLAQTVFGTVQGLASGHTWYVDYEIRGRIVANLDRVPVSELPCYEDIGVVPGWSALWTPWYPLAMRDHLSVFEPDTDRVFRAEGLFVLPWCGRL